MSKCQFLNCRDFFDSRNVSILNCQDFFDSRDVRFFNCHDQKSPMRPCGDKPRPQGIIHVKMSVFILTRLFWQLKCQFLNCGDFFDSWDMGFWSVETFLAIKTSVFWTVETFFTVETWALNLWGLFWQSSCQYFGLSRLFWQLIHKFF